MKESSVQQRIRLAAAYDGIDLWRNNVGVLLDSTGRPVRYGLANDSVKLNQELKSSDLIGPTPLFIMPHHVGMILGVFSAIECKEEGWQFPQPTNHKEYDRAIAQSRFHDKVRGAGGYAGFATCVEDYKRIVRR